ncbi:MAG: hypothetical protein CMF37_14985 [Leeuwenhoekiella sp.]|nr:hypothetical protein [Leeuwenhoekiella sp.]MBQ50081.1 hypothetical protein [Leeuwenhoekiella sp.]MBQ50278.1 hypothetical protein [Leeuwenhoekiella sp.]MBQ50475.1 hypothetical protein [Leeuwenhoekiella sp.]|tara:strand:- start:154 stop:519 length:366 start_codon:yes stop_codon:yes gene_type:complete
MQCYTYQIGKAEDNPEHEHILLINSSVKSGYRWLAPTWALLMAYKQGEITEEQYTEKFKTLMRLRYRRYRNLFEAMSKQEQVAFGCYCKDGDFCHRHLLIEMFEKICNNYDIPFKYIGELK